MTFPFNVRVYGVLINDNNEILVSDEIIRKKYYTKFPGGGLEFGEGTRDCLRREWQEELQQEIEVLDHLYTTDYFQLSAFDNESQVISIYYLVKATSDAAVDYKDKSFDFTQTQNDEEAFRWVAADDFSTESVTLPIDKIVADIVKEKYL